MINLFNKDSSDINYHKVLSHLRDTYIWIPCNAVISAVDVNNLINAKAGDVISNENDIRMIPETLINGEYSFFPVFSDTNKMGKTFTGYSQIEKPFLEALNMARDDKQLSGIVVDAFSEPFIITK